MQNYFLNNWLWLDLWTFLLFPYDCVLCFHSFAFSKTLLQINVVILKSPSNLCLLPTPQPTSLCGPISFARMFLMLLSAIPLCLTMGEELSSTSSHSISLYSSRLTCFLYCYLQFFWFPNLTLLRATLYSHTAIAYCIKHTVLWNLKQHSQNYKIFF